MERKDNNLLKEKTKEQMIFDYTHFGYLLEETEQLAAEIFTDKERREIEMSCTKATVLAPRSVSPSPKEWDRPAREKGEFGTPRPRRRNYYDS